MEANFSLIFSIGLVFCYGSRLTQRITSKYRCIYRAAEYMETVSIKFNKKINGEMSCNENIFSLERYSWMDGRSTHLTQMNQGDSDLESLKETDVGAQETIRWRGPGGKYMLEASSR